MGLRAQLLRQQPPPATLIDRLSQHDVREITSRNAFTKGQLYWHQGRVLALDVRDDGARIRAQVRGSERRPYSQNIEITLTHGILDIAGDCSCPVGFNCKHVAAALLAAIARNAAKDGRPAASTGASRARGGGSLELFPDIKPSHAPEAPPPERLDAELAAWIDSLARLEQTESEDYPAEIRQRLIYVLAIEPRGAGAPQLVAKPTSVRLLKNDAFSDKTTPVQPHSIQQHNAAKFLRPSDRDILKRLNTMPSAVQFEVGRLLSGEEGVTALKAMIATGRARWGSVFGPVVTEGPARRGRVAWRLADDGSHHPDIELEGERGPLVLRLAPPWYVDINTATMGPVETGLPARIAGGILSAPAVPARQSRLLRAAIERRLPGLSGIEPPDVEPPQQIDKSPVPILRLMACHLPRQSFYGYGYGYGARSGLQPEHVLIARASFRYGSFELGADDPRDGPTFARDGRIFEIARRRGAERRSLGRLSELGFEKLSLRRPYGLPPEHRSDFVLADDDDGKSGWLDLLYHEVPALRAAGWQVEIAADFPVRLVRGDGDVAAEIREGSGIDWFELDLGVLIDGERIDLVPAILALLANTTFDGRVIDESSDDGLPFYLPLDDGRVLAMPAARLRPILRSLHELFTTRTIDPNAERLGFSVRDAAGLADFEAVTGEIGMVWRGGERLREIGRLLRESGGIPRIALPASFSATLRPYQARGVDWLQFLRSVGLGGVLADEMGLGKTVQTLAHLAIERESGRMERPALVVAPTSVIANWRREAQRFTPELKVLTLHGLDRKSRFGEIAAHDLILTTYPLIARDHAALKAQSWHLVILDEAQTIKNPAAATTRLVGELEARHRLCLTGTPLENHLGELWSLFAFLSPGFLGDSRSFKRNWRTPIEKRGDGDRRRLLARRIRPFLLRRSKSEVAADLPPKTEIVEPIEMAPAQRELYETIRLTMHARVRAAISAKGLARSRIVVLDALLKLRQACCDPRLLKLKTPAAAKAASAKLERLMEMLPELIEDGRRVLLFSQFTSMLALIEQALSAAAIPYVLLTGDTRDRETPIRRFQAGEVPLFLISLKAGGLGLNLTAADTVIHYDPWWNPAVEDQATDRAHRLGQDKPVFVHKLVMLASIEEKMESLKTRKRELAAGLFDPDAGSTLDLTEADVDDLFAAPE